MPEEDKEKSLKFIRHENGLDVYWNTLTSKEVFCWQGMRN